MFLEIKPTRQLQRSLVILDLGMKRLGPLATLQLAAIECERMRGAVNAVLDRIAVLGANGGNHRACLKLRGDILTDTN